MVSSAAAPENVYGDVGGVLPSGFKVFTTFPDLLMVLEWVFGGLVWILVATTTLPFEFILLQGWVMFVSVFCFVMTTTLLILYLIGSHGGQAAWTSLDAFLNCIMALLYFSAAVMQACVTIRNRDKLELFKLYGKNVAAVVFIYLATLCYVIHALFALIRWKRFS